MSNTNKKDKNDKNNNVSAECTCTTCQPKCPYFPNPETCEWVYDEKEPYIKRRKERTPFICNYDGHQILSWNDICPRNCEAK